MTRHEIQVLRQEGVPGRRVATLTLVSKRSAWRIAKEATLSNVAPTERRKRAIGRPSTVTAFTPAIKGPLAEDRHLPSIEILHRLQEQGYGGGKSAVHELIPRLRPVSTSPVVRFEGVPGEFS